jgi:hypothetical protein
LFGLRALTRRAAAVLWVSMPAWLLEARSGGQRALHLADTVLDLHSFTGDGGLATPEAAGFGDFDGIVRLRRLPALHALVAPPGALAAACETPNYLFKVKRKRLALEKLSLPPEESRVESSGCHTHGHNDGPASSGGAKTSRLVGTGAEPKLPAQLDF